MLNPIGKLHKDIDDRIMEECEKIKEADNPAEEIDKYVRTICWRSPALAEHVENEMLKHVDVPIYVSKHVPPPPSEPIPPRIERKRQPMYCPECGEHHFETNKYCEYCGKKLTR